MLHLAVVNMARVPCQIQLGQIPKAAGGPGVVSTFYLSNNGGLYDKRLGLNRGHGMLHTSKNVHGFCHVFPKRSQKLYKTKVMNIHELKSKAIQRYSKYLNGF